MKINYRIEKDIPVITRADVAVVGGGPGGIGAAVMAARAGAKTVLVERYGILGGMASMGEVHPFMVNHLRGKCLDRPVYMDWAHMIASYLPPELRPAEEDAVEIIDKARDIEKDAAALAAEELCLEAGVELLYHHTLADVIKTKHKVTHAVLLSKSGFAAVDADVFIDSTGDGDLAVKAGCRFEQGGPSGHSQPMTLCFKLSHVDRERMPERDAINEQYVEAQKSGAVSCPRHDVLMFDTHDDDVIHFNTTRVIHKNGTDGRELSQAEQAGHRQVREYLAWFRECVPGFEKARIHSIGHHIGVRETRRIKGMDTIERKAFDQCTKFDDAIARVRYMIDIHNPDGGGTEHAFVPEGDWYEIPYGCIVADGVDNVLIGSRCISVDHAIHSSMRVMPIVCSVGQAAGMAAAMAVSRKKRPAELDGKEVRNCLIEMGAALT